jgi:hypothetical protein
MARQLQNSRFSAGLLVLAATLAAWHREYTAVTIELACVGAIGLLTIRPVYLRNPVCELR